MSREVRRVPLGWQHPTRENPHWALQSSYYPGGRPRPTSRLHAPHEQFVGLMDDYADSLARWESEGAELVARTGSSWEFYLEWNLTGIDDATCQCHEGQSGVIHPHYSWSEDGMTEIATDVRDEDHLHELRMATHHRSRPDPADYMPAFDDVHPDDLGWCLYETVSEGTPATPVFATAQELIDHLATVGQDWDQVPMRRSAAETLVRTGSSFGSLISLNGTLLRSDTDADRIEAGV